MMDRPRITESGRMTDSQRTADGEYHFSDLT